MAKALFNETVLVLCANQYDIDGNRGTSLQYVSADYAESERNRGTVPVDASAPFEMFQELHTLPGIYEVSFGRGRSVRNARNQSKSSMEPVGATFVEPLDLEVLVDSTPVAK